MKFCKHVFNLQR
jgi:hypothetical protein